MKPKKPMLWLLCLMIGLNWLVLTTVQQAKAFQVKKPGSQLVAPTGDRDLVVFIAKFKPHLYRLVGPQPIPYGTVRFYSPIALVADSLRKCLYVLDEPQLLSENTKIWRIDPDGSGKIIFQGKKTMRGGPFGKPKSLGIDAEGRLLVADAVTGLWRLEANGYFQRLFDGQQKPFFKITAVTGTPKKGLIVGTSYMHEITGGQILNLPHQRYRSEGWSPSPSYSNEAFVSFWPVDPFKLGLDHTGVGNSTGRQVPIRTWKNQGGVYTLDLSRNPPGVAGTIVNREPGGNEYQTYWRNLTQLWIDAGGRLILVDAGSTKKRSEDVYISPGYVSDTKRVTESKINGGVFVLHPDGRFEELTYKGQGGRAGPLRFPHAAAQWSKDTYIVADPEMYVQGINGTGGLLLLKLDGTREARWPFGYRLKPLGVAVLRAAGAPTQIAATRQIGLAELAGIKAAGPITRIETVTWERKPNDNSPLSGIGMNWQVQPANHAAARLRNLFEGAQWIIGKNGELRFTARGVDPGQQGTPLVMGGQVTVHGQTVNASANYKSPNMFDTQVGSLNARIYSHKPGSAVLNVTVNIFTKNDRLKASFRQDISLR